MRVRFSTVIGKSVLEDHTHEEAGMIAQIFINPDTAVVEGFFVHVPGMLHAQEAFLSTLDIARWGTQVRVRNVDVLAPLEERVRLFHLFEEGRPVLGQMIVTESGSILGRCRDVQFDTTTFHVEWLFPRKWFRWMPAIPTSSIVKVTRDAIVVRDAVTIPEALNGPSVLETLDPLGSAGVSRKVE